MKIKINSRYLIFSILIAIVFLVPYYLPQVHWGHDLFYHLGRIEGLVNAADDHQILPKIYPYKNFGFGYASALFYSDVFMYLPALLKMLGLSLFNSYLVVVFFSVVFASYFVMILVAEINGESRFDYLAGMLYTFSTYHIVDVFTRAAIGECLAITFFPLVMLAAYRLFVRKREATLLLTVAFSALLLSHNLGFLLAVVSFGIFCLFYIRDILTDRVLLYSLLKAVGLTILITAFFLFPMLEMLGSDTYNLNHVQDYYRIKNYTLDFSQLFINEIRSASAGRLLAADEQMTVNIGWLLTFLPLSYIFVKKTKFLSINFVLGYLCVLLTLDIVPYADNSMFNIIQFPWRLLFLSMTHLTIVSSYSLKLLLGKNRSILFVLFAFVMVNFTYQISTVIRDETVVDRNLVYTDISGDVYRDHCSTVNHYNRNELSGAEYLPYSFDVDYEKLKNRIWYLALDETNIEFVKQGTTMYFSTYDEYPGSELMLPVTYYKGYQCYLLGDDGKRTERIPTYESEYYRLVVVDVGEHVNNDFVLVYEGTLVQKTSLVISFLTIIILIGCLYRRK